MNYKTFSLLLLCLNLINPAFSVELSAESLAEPHADEIQASFLMALQEQVLTDDSAAALTNLEQIKASLQTLQAEPTQLALDQVQTYFSRFIRSWKAVEAIYVLGTLDDDFLDHPRFIDYFHQTKESIPEQVEKALDSKKPLKEALFKYSTRSVNALEYLLFARPQQGSLLDAMNPRRIEAAEIAVDNIAHWLGDIAQAYRVEDQLLAESNGAVGVVVNALIDSSYKLANWRVGEAGGLVKKYAGKPSAQHLEYPLSAASYLAIETILQTHRKVIDRDDAVDLLALAQTKNAEAEVLYIRDQIDAALNILAGISQPLSEHVGSVQYQALYEQLYKLHIAYYSMLIDALGLNANIIDADGD